MVFSDYDNILDKEVWIDHLISIHFILIPLMAIFSLNPPWTEGEEGGVESEYWINITHDGCHCIFSLSHSRILPSLDANQGSLLLGTVGKLSWSGFLRNRLWDDTMCHLGEWTQDSHCRGTRGARRGRRRGWAELRSQQRPGPAHRSWDGPSELAHLRQEGWAFVPPTWTNHWSQGAPREEL